MKKLNEESFHGYSMHILFKVDNIDAKFASDLPKTLD
jgi:hypothetical protein